MQSKVVKSDIILLSLILLFLSIIIILVDFPKTKNKDYDVNVYKAYYVYDTLSTPVSLTYYLINTDTSTSTDIIIDKILTKTLKNININLNVENININNNTLELTINDQITKYNINDINSLVNSLTEINNIKEVKFINKDNTTNTYYNSLDKYYINSPISNKLYTFLYRDTNYKISYIDKSKEINYLTIKKNKDNYVIYNYNNEEYKMHIKEDGLYLNDKKILNNTYKVNDTWDTHKITKKTLTDNNTLLISVTNKEETFKEIYQLEQGIGLYSYQKVDNKNNIIETITYQKKEFNND